MGRVHQLSHSYTNSSTPPSAVNFYSLLVLRYKPSERQKFAIIRTNKILSQDIEIHGTIGVPMCYILPATLPSSPSPRNEQWRCEVHAGRSGAE